MHYGAGRAKGGIVQPREVIADPMAGVFGNVHHLPFGPRDRTLLVGVGLNEASLNGKTHYRAVAALIGPCGGR